MSIFILFGLPLIISVIDFLGFLIKGKRIVHIVFIRIIEIAAFLVLPYLYLSLDTFKNNCCGESTAFSPEHQLTMWVIIGLCLAAYFYSSYRKSISTPILEVLVNCFLVLGIVLNIFIGIHTKSYLIAALGDLPIILLAIMALAKNQKAFVEQSVDLEFSEKSKLTIFARKILNLQPLVKYPILFVLCLPILLLISTTLLLFGQKPDSIIRAFTDTYKHGFSQWNYMCENVQCGGHYLCSVAANGHAKIVKPQRQGIRNGHNIICNRQLLISNAFEELIQEKFPFLHKRIRRQYNKVGDVIHRYYGIFENKFVSDLIYVLMKPFEWFFLLTIYTFDRKPENRIAKQYISNVDRLQIERH
jgi:hypothetical protein